jgi:hypothetical protein
LLKNARNHVTLALDRANDRRFALGRVVLPLIALAARATAAWPHHFGIGGGRRTAVWRFFERHRISRINPSGYVETQGAFARRLADEMRRRLGLKC